MIINSQTVPMLTQVFNAAFQRGFAGFGTDDDWSKVASQEMSTTRQSIYPYLGKFPKLRQWVGDRQVKNFQQYSYSLENQRFESTIEVNRVDIEDDQYGVYTRAFQQAGESVKVWPNDMVYGGGLTPAGAVGAVYGAGIGGAAINGATNLCYDGQAFFNASHPMANTTQSNYDSTTGSTGGGNPNGNLWMLIDNSKPIMPFIFQLRQSPEITARMNLQDPAVFDRDVFTWGIRARGAAGYGFWQLAYGSIGDISLTNFRAYRAAMKEVVSDEGYRLGVSPKLLVCGPALEATARDLLKRQLIPASGTSGTVSNAEFEAVDLLVTPHLP